MSTSEVVCNTNTPRDIYFSLKEWEGEEKTIVEYSLFASKGAFGIDWKKNETKSARKSNHGSVREKRHTPISRPLPISGADSSALEQEKQLLLK